MAIIVGMNADTFLALILKGADFMVEGDCANCPARENCPPERQEEARQVREALKRKTDD